MENKKRKTLSEVALIVSIIPLATLIPVFLKITLPEVVCCDKVSTVWAGVNVASAVAGLILSGVCVRSDEGRSPVNIWIASDSQRTIKNQMIPMRDYWRLQGLINIQMSVCYLQAKETDSD